MDTNTPESIDHIRQQLETAHYCAQNWREFCEKRLKAHLPLAIPFEALLAIADDYAEAKAKELLSLRALEGCGFEPWKPRLPSRTVENNKEITRIANEIYRKKMED